jgi:cyclophilin family peptidyl-prolyl cis-trans isomerase
MIKWPKKVRPVSYLVGRLFCFGIFLPLALAGQNQPPVLESLIPNQMMDQGGSAMKLDLTQFFKDPDVSSPAVKIDVKIAGNTKQIYFGLLKEAAPLTSSNFVAYIEAGHFAENFIHRSVPGFIIQGGGFRFSQVQTIQDVPNFDPVINEPGISNTRGTVAMAKLGGNPNSATSEWFINLANNASNLDNQNGGFTVFARVLGNGMTVADEIVALRVYDASYQLGSGAFGELPLSAPTLARSSFVETAASLVSPLQFSAESNAPNIVSLTLSLDGELTMTPSPINAGEAIISITVTDLEGGITESSFKTPRLSPSKTGKVISTLTEKKTRDGRGTRTVMDGTTSSNTSWEPIHFLPMGSPTGSRHWEMGTFC